MSKIVYEVTVENNHIEWRLNGKKHREDGPAIKLSNGTKSWFINGNRHREDGPAIEYADGATSWYKNGKLHREDGPATEHADGSKFWFLDNKDYTKEEFDKEITRRNNSCDGKIVEIDGKKYTLKEYIE